MTVLTEEQQTAVRQLQFLMKSYDRVTGVIQQIRNSMQAVGDVEDERFHFILGGEEGAKGLLSVKGMLSRRIEKALPLWPIWNQWLEKIPGIGPAIGGQLILLYYYKFIPICDDCGKDIDTEAEKWACSACGKVAKGGGLLKYRVALRDFPNISKWHKYMGMHVEDGKKPKRQKGQQSNWSTPGRTLAYQIGDQFNRRNAADHPYKAFLEARKRKRQQTHPNASKGHVMNMARHEAGKLFLSHFWAVAREIAGLPVTEPYAGTIMGHTGIIQPFYWGQEGPKMTGFESVLEKEEADAHA